MSAAIYAITNQKPDIIYTDDGKAKITFSPDAVKGINNFIAAQLAKKGGNVDIDLIPIATPFILTKVLPVALLTFAGIFTLGYFARGNK